MVQPRSLRSLPTELDLNTICVQKEYRTIRREHTFSFDCKMYVIYSPTRYSIKNQ